MIKPSGAGVEPKGYEVTTRNILVMMDSKYVVDGITKWIFKWRTNGFRKVIGDLVTNWITFVHWTEWLGNRKWWSKCAFLAH